MEIVAGVAVVASPHAPEHGSRGERVGQADPGLPGIPVDAGGGLEQAVRLCPVAASLHPDVELAIIFEYV